jgi:hypothetical protein
MPDQRKTVPWQEWEYHEECRRRCREELLRLKRAREVENDARLPNQFREAG